MMTMLLALAFSLSSQAEDLVPLQNLFHALEPGSAQCYGREYSEAELQKHPKQTVKNMRVKLRKDVSTPDYPTSLLDVEVGLKGEQNRFKVFRATLFCPEDGNSCLIECDGGSVEAWGKTDGSFLLKNNGFVLEGGCGEEMETIFLTPSPGGDDIFRLQSLPKEYCQL